MPFCTRSHNLGIPYTESIEEDPMIRRSLPLVAAILVFASPLVAVTPGHRLPRPGRFDQLQETLNPVEQAANIMTGDHRS